MNTRIVLVLLLTVSAPPVLADSATAPMWSGTKVGPLGPPVTNPNVIPITTAIPAQPPAKSKKKDPPKMPQMPQMPPGGGAGGGNQAQKNAAATSDPTQSKSGKDASATSDKKGPSGDGLCTTKNEDKVQKKNKGCDKLDAAVEQGCAASKLGEIVKKAGKDGKGISDLEKYCGNYGKLPDRKKKQLFTQLVAKSIDKDSGWTKPGLMKIEPSDVDHYQDCHDLDLTKDKTNDAKILKCGACKAFTEIASGKIETFLKDEASQKKVAESLSDFCSDTSDKPDIAGKVKVENPGVAPAAK